MQLTQQQYNNNNFRILGFRCVNSPSITEGDFSAGGVKDQKKSGKGRR
ncbi:hypothetical protein Hipma_0668 [Hippea maritima DSM 10411]|uniref:Uncharacterized protein n=1 Tax=Hippea maritima (strain ATCC 700847 / DSM 10411 / MH2) TaxID=760142 RepID=F2LV54_HIPMA|nr:hypothetical protein Hipma_0668 [Hippea maritima DSM 10411]